LHCLSQRIDQNNTTFYNSNVFGLFNTHISRFFSFFQVVEGVKQIINETDLVFVQVEAQSNEDCKFIMGAESQLVQMRVPRDNYSDEQ